jgi:DNA-binding winged helix-turn-helix (wHTH) protein
VCDISLAGSNVQRANCFSPANLFRDKGLEELLPCPKDVCGLYAGSLASAKLSSHWCRGCEVAVSPTEDVVRFGLFELDLKAGQLSKNGAKIRLSQQPFQLLSVLLERPGEVLTREELRQRLWSSDVFVDFDHGLNKSIQKIRDALGDSADSPRYIETVPRVGYRFIAPVSGGVRSPELEPNVTIPQIMLDLPAARPAAAISGDHGGRWFLMAGCVALLALTVGWLIHPARMQPGEPIRSLAVLPLDNLSGDPSQDYFADGMTDELTTMLAKNSRLRIVSRTGMLSTRPVVRRSTSPSMSGIAMVRSLKTSIWRRM